MAVQILLLIQCANVLETMKVSGFGVHTSEHMTIAYSYDRVLLVLNYTNYILRVPNTR